ncbi:rhamnogalacturonan acetylesterase [Sporosarcina ureilytica]|uniref:Rhamnogalacturonan acetylesterase n=1 Tax=Sporosarcina ureilytica TaxID=298596 RepID=A0A1D8JIR0_9BACL|nr:rhamnogalacturonan acetylesterase [Sporosarcina ureilytica]AOV08603.1 rhamnogalacturonan acetylesterase [Sporosarcina ureilytica]
MDRNPTIYLAGDSTVRNYDKSQYPQAGWGQFLGNYLTKTVTIKNYAVGGLSSKTFITEGHLSRIDSEIAENDYLFIQFGHNDSTRNRADRFTEPYGDYQIYLKQYIDLAKSKKAIPILLTPVARLNYVQDRFSPDFSEYCNAMKELANENEVLLIDLMSIGVQYLSSIGYTMAQELYMLSVNGTDCTHFTERGANIMARLVSEQLIELPNGLDQLIK